jgi:hypothetical protein
MPGVISPKQEFTVVINKPAQPKHTIRATNFLRITLVQHPLLGLIFLLTRHTCQDLQQLQVTTSYTHYQIHTAWSRVLHPLLGLIFILTKHTCQDLHQHSNLFTHTDIVVTHQLQHHTLIIHSSYTHHTHIIHSSYTHHTLIIRFIQHEAGSYKAVSLPTAAYIHSSIFYHT